MRARTNLHDCARIYYGLESALRGVCMLVSSTRAGDSSFVIGSEQVLSSDG